jgi:hypothetical protein
MDGCMMMTALYIDAAGSSNVESVILNSFILAVLK